MIRETHKTKNKNYQFILIKPSLQLYQSAMVLSSRSPRAFGSERHFLLDRFNFVRRNSLFSSPAPYPISFDPTFEQDGPIMDHVPQLFDRLSGEKRRLSTPCADLDFSLLEFLRQNLLNPTPFEQLSDAVLVEDSASDTSSEPPKKRRKAKSDETKFRPYQAEKWHEKYAELVEYKDKYGNAMVPHTFPANPPLARWVKRQRHQRVLQKRGDPRSSCTPERVALLDTLGFVWDSHEVSWLQRLEELEAYKSKHGHCLVPSTYPTNAQLATWVKCQRRQYKLFAEGKTSNITQERIDQLNDMGFEWELRTPQKLVTDPIDESIADSVDESFLSFFEVFSDLSDSDETDDGDEPLPANFGW